MKKDWPKRYLKGKYIINEIVHLESDIKRNCDIKLSNMNLFIDLINLK